MKTIEEINKRWWYRLIKSIYLILFIGVAIIGVWATYNANQPWTINENTIINPQAPLSIYNITSTPVTMGSTTNAVWYSVLALLIIAVIFEAIRRIFYYVVLGSLRPPGKHLAMNER